MAADEKVLGALHDAVATVLIDALKGQEIPGYTDEDGNEVPGGKMLPSAAIIQAATKFLKDNNITCAPSGDNGLGELADMVAARTARRNASKADLAVATEQAAFLRGLN